MRSLGRNRRLQSPTLLWPRYTLDITGPCSPGFKASLLPSQPRNLAQVMGCL